MNRYMNEPLIIDSCLLKYMSLLSKVNCWNLRLHEYSDISPVDSTISLDLVTTEALLRLKFLSSKFDL